MKIFPKRHLLPQMTATNAYQLLDDVIAAITVEPRRLNMRQWVMSALSLGEYAKSRVPECGTVACCAGWICVLARPNIAIRMARTGLGGGISSTARGLLGFNGLESYTSMLFSAAVARDGKLLRPGTKKYALAVVDRIRQFQAQHAVRLLNTPVNRA